MSKYSHCLGNSPSHYKQTNIELPSGTSDNYGSLVQNLRVHCSKLHLFWYEIIVLSWPDMVFEQMTLISQFIYNLIVEPQFIID